MTQMCFGEVEIIEYGLYISDKCNQCIHKCKVYCVSKDAEVYCNKYKKDNVLENK